MQVTGAIGGNDPRVGTAENYLRFAQEAEGRSPAYVELARAVAADNLILKFLGSLPRTRRQPNLLFATARYLLGTPADHGTLRALIGSHERELYEMMLARRTQTNEPARCATLLPALAQLAQPLALIEVGASAGLTLLFDRYSYDYDGHFLAGRDPEAPVLRCAVSGPVPLPAAMPVITWRAGLDLNPLDVRDDSDVQWLTCLIWPGEGDREQRLAAAVAAARRDPPAIHRGDLRTDLPALAATAPPDATLVIYHSAVLAYVPGPDRERFADTVRDLPAVWLSNEAPGVLAGAPAPVTAPGDASFVLIRDGRTLLAVTDGHGEALHWLG